MRLTDYKFRRKFDIPKYIRTLGQKPKKIIDFSQKVCILGIILLSIFSTGMVVYGSTFIRPTAQKIGTPSSTNGQAEKNVKTGLSSTGTGIASDRVSKKAVNQDHADQRITGIKSVSAKNNQPAAQTSTYGGTVSGNGATQLHMNESLDTTNTVTNLHINNSFVTTTLSNSTVINQSVTGYTNVTGTFAITNIQATYNYTNVDNNTNIADDTAYNSNTNGLIQTSYQYAQAFTITNAEVNMTKVRIVYTQTGSPSGDLVIYDSSGSNGSPGSEIPNSPSIALQNLPKDSNDNWTTITFASPVTLTAGKYYLVLQDTTPSLNFGSNYFTRYVQYINANTEGLYQASSGSSSWSPVNDKLLFTYKSITIGSNNQPFIYTAPAAVDLTYNGNSVTNTSNNLLDLKTNTAIFTSNDSIVFDFTYQIHYNRANPIVTTITYAVANNTNPTWNVTATTDSIPSGSYSVSNRIFMLYSLANDWNKTTVLQNISFFSIFVFSNGSSILLLFVSSSL